MSAATAAAPHASWRFDPVLAAAFVASMLLAALFVAPPGSPVSAPALNLAVADLRGHALVVLNTGAPGAARRIALPGGPHEFAALPDGRIAVSLEQYDPRGEVLAASLSADGVVALVQHDQVRRVVVGGVPDGLAFSPDGRWLYVGDMVGGAVSVVEVARARVVQRIPVAESVGTLLVLPFTD